MKCHFTITGEFITKHVRHLWLSDSPYAAFEIFRSINMPDHLAIKILLGDAKLTGDSDGDLLLGRDSDRYWEPLGIDVSFAAILSRVETSYVFFFANLMKLKRDKILLHGRFDEEKTHKIVTTHSRGPRLKAAPVDELPLIGRINQKLFVDAEKNSFSFLNFLQRIKNVEEGMAKEQKNLEELYRIMGKDPVSNFCQLSIKASEMNESLSEVEKYAIVKNQELERERERNPVSFKQELTRKDLDALSEEIRNFNEDVKDFDQKFTSVGYKTADLETERERIIERARLLRVLDSIDPDLLDSDSFSIKVPMMLNSRPEDVLSGDLYILPDGKIYEVGFQGHLFFERLSEIDAPWTALGWIKISDHRIILPQKKITPKAEQSLFELVYTLPLRFEFEESTTPDEVIQIIKHKISLINKIYPA